MTILATLIFVIGIAGLFILERQKENRASAATWLPVMWLLIAGSRQVSVWLNMAPARSADQYLEGSPLDRNIYSALLVAGICVLISRSSKVKTLLKQNWPVVMFVIYCGLSVVWSDYPFVAGKRWIKSLGDYVMLMIILTDKNRTGALKTVLARVAFVLLPMSILLIKYYPDLGRAYSRWEGTQYFVGVAQDKNMLGMTCLVFGIAAAWRVTHEMLGPKRGKVLIVQGTILGMTLWLFRIVNSMTSLSCFVLACGLMAATSYSRFARKRAIVHLMVVSALLVCAAPLFLDFGTSFLKTMGRDPSLTGRTEIWEVLLQVPIDPIIGTGFESFWLGSRLDALWQIPYMKGINEAHNGYLELYLNLGWVGLFLLGVIIIVAYRNVLRSMRINIELASLQLAYFVVGLAYCFTEAAVRTMNLVWWMFLLAVLLTPDGILPSMQRNRKRQPETDPEFLDSNSIAPVAAL